MREERPSTGTAFPALYGETAFNGDGYAPLSRYASMTARKASP